MNHAAARVRRRGPGAAGGAGSRGRAGFSLVDQTKIVTAASEIARNTVDYGGGGTVRIEVLRNGQRRGVRLTFTDQGPGIADLTLGAMTDGYTTGSGLGLGLSGAKRLCNEFDVKSTPGPGHHGRSLWRVGISVFTAVSDRQSGRRSPPIGRATLRGAIGLPHRRASTRSQSS